MSDIANGVSRAPKAVIEPVIESVADSVEDAAAQTVPEEGPSTREGAARAAGCAESFHDATFGFFRELGRRVWEHADAHPHATLYGILGFVLAVLILVIGLWDTIVIAVFVGVGVVVGQMRDGDNAVVNFVRRLIDK